MSETTAQPALTAEICKDGCEGCGGGYGCLRAALSAAEERARSAEIRLGEALDQIAKLMRGEASKR